MSRSSDVVDERTCLLRTIGICAQRETPLSDTRMTASSGIYSHFPSVGFPLRGDLKLDAQVINSNTVEVKPGAIRRIV